MTSMEVDGRAVRLFPARSAVAPLVILYGQAGAGEAVREGVAALTGADYALAAVEAPDWNAALSPWPSPPVFRGGEAFAGGADRTLAQLTEALLPEMDAALGGTGPRVLAGYSLAGLFALYGLYRTNYFAGAVSVSGSLWYPGFLEYATKNAPAAAPGAVYLSVGDREARTKNPVMRTVEDHTARLAAHYRALGIETLFELNPGNHFQDAHGRTARGVAWMVRRLTDGLQ